MAVKARKKTAKVAKKPVRKAAKAKRSLKAAPSTKRTRARPRAKTPPVRKDETTIKLGPHHLDRHPVVGGIQVRPAPQQRPMVPATHLHPVTVRHH